MNSLPPQSSSEHHFSSDPRRLAIVCPSLQFGGAERVAAMMADHWATRGDEVTLITLSSAETDTYELNPQVRRLALDVMGESGSLFSVLWNNLRRIRKLKAAVRSCRPQAVISLTVITNVLTLLACRRLATDVIIAERTNPQRHPIGKVWSLLRRWTYPRCHALVVQTEFVREQMQSVVKGRPVYVIPNAVRADRDQKPGFSEKAGLLAPPPTEAKGFRVLGVGRLSREKGFDLLIEAFARIAEKHLDWTLQILGEGPARGELESLIRQKILEKRVTLAGWVADPSWAMRYAHLFVLPSRFEGFPNALLEAMACGLPVIAFDCDAGPREIITGGTDGLLVPQEDVDALAKAMDRLISSEAERQRLRAQAVEVVERFSVKRFFASWEQVLARSAETVAHTD